MKRQLDDTVSEATDSAASAARPMTVSADRVTAAFGRHSHCRKASSAESVQRLDWLGYRCREVIDASLAFECSSGCFDDLRRRSCCHCMVDDRSRQSCRWLRRSADDPLQYR